MLSAWALGLCCVLHTCAALTHHHIFGSGTPALNGQWEPNGMHNDFPQFTRVAGGRRFELFLQKQQAGNWWIIQEVRRGSLGVLMYGDVLYRRRVSDSSHGSSANTTKGDADAHTDADRPGGQVVPARGWEGKQEARGDDLVGSAPAPVFATLSETVDFGDCSTDACAEYFFARDFLSAMLAMSCTRPDEPRFHEWCFCQELNPFRPIPAEELHALRAQYAAEGYVTIPNILQPDMLATLMQDLPRFKARYFWHWSFWNPDVGEWGSAHMMPAAPDNEKSRDQWLTKQHDLRRRNEYAYFFTRTLSHPPWFQEFFFPRYYARTIDMLSSAHLLGTIAAITNHSHELSEYFYSRYTSGSFLDIHSDSVQDRKIAFTLHFTQGWQYTYGGLLYLFGDDWKTVRRVLLPTNNVLTLMDVSKEVRMLPHCVTEVVQSLDAWRVALTGWYQRKGMESDLRPVVNWRV